MKIVVLDGYALNPGDISWDEISMQGDFLKYDNTDDNDAAARIGDAEIIFVNKVPITREVIAKCKNLKYVGVLATGYNVVDTAACAEAGIVVTIIPTYGTTAVAQYTFALMLELCHHVGEHSRSVVAGDWAKSRNFSYWNYPLIELQGKTLGVIGYGRIGQAVGKIAQAFGMRVLAYDKVEFASCVSETMCYAPLDELLEQSDFISLNCPLTPENKGFINKANIAKMKKGVYIVNTARGPLINEIDLKEALESGQVAGAAVDVLSAEPPTGGNPLIGARNSIVTPHIAWAAKESRERLMKLAAENLRAFIAGKPINKVN
jgi:glycerate dehydrogenase